MCIRDRAVTHPSAGNIGGGGFMVIRPAKGAPITIDYRERAPLKSTRTMYLDSTGKIVRERTATGYLAPGVPGTVRGLAPVSYTHLRAHETGRNLVCRLLLE